MTVPYDALPTAELLRHAHNSNDPLVLALCKRFDDLSVPLERWAEQARDNTETAVRAVYEKLEKEVVAVIEDGTLSEEATIEQIRKLIEADKLWLSLPEALIKTINPSSSDLW